MVRFLVSHSFLPGVACWLRPPVWSSSIRSSVWMVGLLLRCKQLDPSLGYGLAGGLLDVLEALVIEFPDVFDMPDDQTLFRNNHLDGRP